VAEGAPLDVTELAKPDRAAELARGRVLLYVYERTGLPGADREVLAGLAADAAGHLRVLVARSPLPDRGQVRLGPALALYEEGRLAAARQGPLPDRAGLERWLRAIKRWPHATSEARSARPARDP
jgi:hypothetical protein